MSSKTLTYDLYTVLGVEKDATSAEIKSAHRKLVLGCHPDRVEESQKSNAEKKFTQVQESYELLYDENRRAKYDKEMRIKEAEKRGRSFSDGRFSESCAPFTDNGARFQTKEPQGKYEDAALDKGHDRAKFYRKDRRRQSSAKDTRTGFDLSETDSSLEFEGYKARRRQSSAKGTRTGFDLSETDSSIKSYKARRRQYSAKDTRTRFDLSETDSSIKSYKARRRQSSAKNEPTASHRTHAEGMPSQASVPRKTKDDSILDSSRVHRISEDRNEQRRQFPANYNMLAPDDEALPSNFSYRRSAHGTSSYREHRRQHAEGRESVPRMTKGSRKPEFRRPHEDDREYAQHKYYYYDGNETGRSYERSPNPRLSTPDRTSVEPPSPSSRVRRSSTAHPSHQTRSPNPGSFTSHPPFELPLSPRVRRSSTAHPSHQTRSPDPGSFASCPPFEQSEYQYYYGLDYYYVPQL